MYNIAFKGENLLTEKCFCFIWSLLFVSWNSYINVASIVGHKVRKYTVRFSVDNPVSFGKGATMRWHMAERKTNVGSLKWHGINAKLCKW